MCARKVFGQSVDVVEILPGFVLAFCLQLSLVKGFIIEGSPAIEAPVRMCQTSVTHAGVIGSGSPQCARELSTSSYTLHDQCFVHDGTATGNGLEL